MARRIYSDEERRQRHCARQRSYYYAKKKDGVVALRDYVALDEIREAEYMKDTEIQSALQAIMENGAFRAPDNHEVNVDAGIIFLGNIALDSVVNAH